MRAEAEAVRARIRLGQGPEGNPQVRQAEAALAQAGLDLQRTSVVAPNDGVVTNLRLAPGQFANRGQPVLSFIAGGPRWVSAAMRENQLGNIAPGNRALVVFDDHPGRAGAQANVVVLTRETSLFNPLARLWIRVVALMSFLR